MKVTRSYKLKLYPNQTKEDTMRYTWNRFKEYCQVWVGKLYFNENKHISTQGLGKLANDAEHKARAIIRCQTAAAKATGNKTNIPDLKNIGMTAKLEIPQKKGEFDYWVNILNQWQGKPLKIPAKAHKGLNHALKSGWTFSKTNQCEVKKIGRHWYAIVFVSKEVEKAAPAPETLGVDVGINHGCTDSRGYRGINLGRVIRTQRLKQAERSRQGHKTKFRSKSTIKQLLDKEAKVLIGRSRRFGCSLAVESSKTLSNLRCGRLTGWARCYLHTRLKVLCKEAGIFFTEVWAAYSSQECSQCHHRDRKSRRRRAFKCVSCGYRDDADLNAARNLELRGTTAISKMMAISCR